jgi:transcription elongation GreA/GreB family factor
MERLNDRAKFVQLAEKRVIRAIKDIRLIGNLSNKSNYSYSDEDVRKIIRALDREIKSLRQRFASQGSSDEIVFMLSNNDSLKSKAIG